MRSNPITVVDPEAETSGSGRILRFGYLFYADLAASTADSNTQNALRHLQVCAVVSVRSNTLCPTRLTAPTLRKWHRSCACSGATRWTTPADTRLLRLRRSEEVPAPRRALPCDALPAGHKPVSAFATTNNVLK